MQKSKFVVGIMLMGFFNVEIAIADDAMVLPKGRFRVRLASAYTTAENTYSESGAIESIGSDFSRRLDAKMLAAMSPTTAETIRQLNAASPGLGDQIAVNLETQVKTEAFSNVAALEYGLTDRLSVGIIVPFVKASVDVEAETSPDQALSEKIARLPSADPRRAALQQVQAKLDVNALQATLTNQYGYQDGLRSWSGTGLGDIELGGKFNYHRSSQMMATLKGGVRLPTGRTNDPDLLFDLGFGDGQTDLGLFHLLDYNFTPNLGMTLETGYTVQLPDDVQMRVPISEEVPISPTKVTLDRKLGDIINAEIEGNYTFLKVLTLSARYRYQKIFDTDYSGGNGANLALIENNSGSELHQGAFQLEYTNLAHVRAGRSKFPYAAAAFYRVPLTGENVSDSRTAGIQLKTYF